jgi:MFS family permease
MVFATLQGLVAGVVWNLATPVIAAVVDRRHLDSAIVQFWSLMVVPALVAQPIAVTLVDHSRNNLRRTGPEAYSNSILFCGSLSIAGALVLCIARYVGSRKLDKSVHV